MNTFFRICVTICLFMLVFSLIANLVDSLGAFPHTTGIGLEISSTDTALETITGIEDINMQYLWLGVTTLSLIGIVLLCVFTKSVVPLGLYFFSLIFWTSWVRMSTILSYGGYIPGEFLLVFTVGVMFIFIAAIIGMLTGSG